MSALHPRSLLAICRRQLAGFLSNPVGYIVILVFVAATVALLFFRDDFYDRNLADLYLLHDLMPGVLAILLPLLAMSAWSSERESGTEELLLTMPISLADAVLGKYLAVLGFYTLALVCSSANVLILEFLGSPDYGLVFSDYVAWWALGAVYAAFALLASILVGSQVIAFVIGVLLCCVLWSFFHLTSWAYHFHRGILDVGGLFVALALAVVGISLSLLVLSARRWRNQVMGHIWGQLASIVMVVVICFNVGAIAHLPVVSRFMMADISADSVSSLSKWSLKLIGDLDQPVTITVVVSTEDNIPLHLRAKAQELMDRAEALKRASGGKIRLKLIRPEDPADALGQEAENNFGLQTQEVLRESVIGTRPVGIFMGAMISSGRHKQIIPFFDAGLSPEFELVRAVRTVVRQATESVIPPISLILAVPVTPPAQLLPLVEQARKKAAELATGEGVTLDLIEVDSPDSAAADRAKAAGIEIHEVKTGAVATPAEKAGEEGTAPDAPPAVTKVCFGLVAQGGGYRRVLSWLGDSYDAGSSIDEAVVQLKSSLDKRMKVLGVLKTDLQVNEHQGAMGRQSVDQWKILDELGKHYTIRAVEPSALNGEDNQDIDLVLAALPSSLLQEELEELATFIHQGRPVLILEDPCPIFPAMEGKRVAPRAPKLDPFQQPNQPPREDLPPKGDLRPLFISLGIDLRTSEVGWCNFSPTAELETQFGKNFIWMMRQHGGMSDHEVTKGIGTVLTLFPGVIHPRNASGMDVRPLLQINKDVHGWGTNTVEDFLFFAPQGASPWDGQYKHRGFNCDQVVTYTQDASLRPAFQACEITGRFAYPYDGGAVKKGTQGEKSVQVIVVADTDLMHDQFYSLYVNESGRYQTKDRQNNAGFDVLSSLRNVQFLSNCVDYLAGDSDLVAIRGAYADRRALDRIDERITTFRKDHDVRVAAARKDQEREVAERRALLKADLDDIESRGKAAGRDEQSILQEQEAAAKAAQAQLEVEIAKLARKADKNVREAEHDLEKSIVKLRWTIRGFALGIPSLLLLLVVVIVYLNKLVREKTDIPASRKRSL